MSLSKYNTLLWYENAATKFSEALPLGNGRLGAMVYGSIPEEYIEFNEDTLWSGHPTDTTNADAHKKMSEVRELIFAKKYSEAQKIVEDTMLGPWNESYMPMGNVHIKYHLSQNISNYKRELDTSSAISTVSFSNNGIQISSKSFISAIDNAYINNIASSDAGKLNLSISMDSMLEHSLLLHSNGYLILNGVCPSHVEPNYVNSDNPVIYEKNEGMTYQMHLAVTTKNGEVVYSTEGISVKNADEVTIYMVAATSFNGYDKHPVHEGNNPYEICTQSMECVFERDYTSLKDSHIKDYTSLFSRVEFDIGETENAALPTNIRLERYAAEKNDPSLATLYFNYGRYLLISSSRPGCQAANLQGIWSNEIRPPWSANWTTNINAQMNYWPAETCNLSECHRPLLDLTKDLSVKGEKAAKVNYDCRGWVANHNVDIWRTPTAVGESAQWAYWPFAGAWLCQHIWEHFCFSCNKDFLKQAYPILTSAAIFYVDWVIEDSDGFLATAPSTSPENAFLTVDGERCNVSKSSTMDIALIKELFTNCIKASNILGIDDDFVKDLSNKLERLPSYKIGKWGQLQEWSEDFAEDEVGHRHMSHLYAIYPGYDETLFKDKELLKAVKTTLKRKEENGGGYTGWSCAWMINLYARLLDGDNALHRLNILLGESTFPNMFDLHPPLLFQIDGNFGATAAIAEMLLQSHTQNIHILPALPTAWKNGHIKGLKARGGYTVDIEWENGVLKEAAISATQCATCNIVYNDKIITIYIDKGETIQLADLF